MSILYFAQHSLTLTVALGESLCLDFPRLHICSLTLSVYMFHSTNADAESNTIMWFELHSHLRSHVLEQVMINES